MKWTKLESQAVKLKLIEYAIDKKAYRLWDQIREWIVISHNVVFDKSVVLENILHTAEYPDNDEYIIEAIVED